MELLQGRKKISAFTLTEVVTAIAIVGIVFGGIIAAHVQSARRAEWSGYSMAAQALALQTLEQARSAKWDVQATPAVDEITNLPTVTVATLDIPIASGQEVRATNFVNISTVMFSSNPPVAVHMVSVSTVWPFLKGDRTVLYTNTVANYIAPDR